ncbi:glycosyltransferase [Flavobacterium sp.]|uniref:glycosyltransferase n=1 Tax=Flavobacterium sp. TaxID=239 RepID=UPI003D12D799
MNQNLTVSVCMITYGHENYIREAIESILMQECDFDVELIISNDCSPDKTHLIIQDVLENHPRKSWIKYFNQDKNLGIMPNLFFALEQCTGKYIAMCEGDDYWITENKLQKQVDILEQNQDVGLVYSNIKQYIQKSGQLIDIQARFVQSQKDVIPEMLKSKFVEFATTVFRKTILEQVIQTLKKELEGKVIGDTRIILETVYISKLYFLNEVTAVYRILEGSASHPKQIDKYIFALKDTYFSRKTFVERNNLNRIWLSDSICNTNRGLINTAFVAAKYSDALKLLQNVLILEVFKYCSWTVFRRKMKADIWVKLFLSLVGIGSLRQKMR